eukprot:TRINITY_DN8330_c0_g1_i2.p1 TRINITY_DN8330_c0_g1~~TRINITY_DN8330_c0_g1_i2.p1  ORF type:complete len:105 (-),score=16.15 TRINITY_DN8330_c0_g1_i2:384-698(-)
MIEVGERCNYMQRCTFEECALSFVSTCTKVLTFLLSSRSSDARASLFKTAIQQQHTYIKCRHLEQGMGGREHRKHNTRSKIACLLSASGIKAFGTAAFGTVARP